MKSLFFKPLRISESPDNILFWSDTHFNHLCEHWPLPLWKARGFNSVENHTDGLIRRWNYKSTDNSVGFHLGDFVFGYKSIDNFKNIIRRMSFKDLYIMPGNHNSGWKQVFEEQKGNIWHVTSSKRVIFIPNYLEVISNNQFLVLSHYPILSFNSQAKGAICVYGHVHSNLEKNEIGKLYKQARTKEVTVDVAPFPITLTELKQMVPNEPVTFDHHKVSEAY
jgi:calcineurin-like phosphoesterase family protein